MARKARARGLPGALITVGVVISATGNAQVTREAGPPGAEPACGETSICGSRERRQRELLEAVYDLADRPVDCMYTL